MGLGLDRGLMGELCPEDGGRALDGDWRVAKVGGGPSGVPGTDRCAVGEKCCNGRGCDATGGLRKDSTGARDVVITDCSD